MTVTNEVRPAGTVLSYADALIVLSETLAAAARGGVDVGDLLSQACTAATMQLPSGMALTDARPGSWEASHVEALTFPDAVADGPRPEPIEVECPKCCAPAGEQCWNVRYYGDNKHPHAERIDFAKTAVWCGGVLGWMPA